MGVILDTIRDGMAEQARRLTIAKEEALRQALRGFRLEYGRYPAIAWFTLSTEGNATQVVAHVGDEWPPKEREPLMVSAAPTAELDRLLFGPDGPPAPIAAGDESVPMYDDSPF